MIYLTDKEIEIQSHGCGCCRVSKALHIKDGIAIPYDEYTIDYRDEITMKDLVEEKNHILQQLETVEKAIDILNATT